MNHYYVTTPIYYANGLPHVGNAYTTVLADTLVRFYQFRGHQTFALTGLDEHGEKVQECADKAGVSPQAFVDSIAEKFQSVWSRLGVKFDRFIRTTDSDHKQFVQEILAKVYEKGDITFGEYSGLYCTGCERFLTEKELVDGNCPDHQRPPKAVSEKNYFFNMERYRGALIEHINSNSEFIRPERYRNEVLAMLREPLEPLCISRPKGRVSWGIELPFDSEYVTYVWFDALLNYIVGIGAPGSEGFNRYWPVVEHLVAKDIIKPHGVFWPTMLMSAGIPLFKHLTVHGYWTGWNDSKISKSLGNTVDPVLIKERVGLDALRYYYLREMVFGLDAAFSPDTLNGRYNSDLANSLGNLVSRTTAMVEKYRQGEVPTSGSLTDLERDLIAIARECLPKVIERVERRELNRALEEIWVLVAAANVYVDRSKPWVLAKEEGVSGGSRDRLDTVLYTQLELVRMIASLVSAFLPDSSVRILGWLGYGAEAIKLEQCEAAAGEWGRLKPGVKIERAENLFPKFEEQEIKVNESSTVSATAVEVTKDGKEVSLSKEQEISYDEFSRVQLRVGQIMSAERIIKSDKLLKLQVDIGESSGVRQIVAGIGKRYQPEELVGRKVAVVSNLKPAKLMGEMSNGMLLAAGDDALGLELLVIPSLMPVGSIVK